MDLSYKKRGKVSRIAVDRIAVDTQQFSFSKKSLFNQKNVQIVERKHGIGVQKGQFGHFLP
jgi:hypothetical protein